MPGQGEVEGLPVRRATIHPSEHVVRNVPGAWWRRWAG